MSQWLRSVPIRYRLAATLVFAGLIIALSIVPGIEQPDDTLFSWIVVNTIRPLQKGMHIAMYGTLTFLCIWTLQSLESRFIRIALSFGIALGLGVLLEWYQTMVPGRYGSLLDVLFNVAGSVIGVVAAILLL